MTPQEELQIRRQIKAGVDPKTELALRRALKSGTVSEQAAPTPTNTTPSIAEFDTPYMDAIGGAMSGLAQGAQSIPLVGDAIQAGAGLIGDITGLGGEDEQQQAIQQAADVSPNVATPVALGTGLAGSMGAGGAVTKGMQGLKAAAAGLGLTGADSVANVAKGEQTLEDAGTNMGIEAGLSALLPGAGKAASGIRKYLGGKADALEPIADASALSNLGLNSGQVAKIGNKESQLAAGKLLRDRVITKPGMTSSEIAESLSNERSVVGKQISDMGEDISAKVGKDTGVTRTGLQDDLKLFAEGQRSDIASILETKMKRQADKVLTPELRKKLADREQLQEIKNKLLPRDVGNGFMEVPDADEFDELLKKGKDLNVDYTDALDANQVSFAELRNIRNEFSKEKGMDAEAKAQILKFLTSIEDDVAAGITPEYKKLKNTYSKIMDLAGDQEKNLDKLQAKELLESSVKKAGPTKRFVTNSVAAALMPIGRMMRMARPALEKAGLVEARKHKDVFDAAKLTDKIKKLRDPKTAKLLGDAAKNGPQAVAATHYLLIQKDEKYRKQMTDEED